MTFNHLDLENFTKSIFLQLGFNLYNANLAAKNLIRADLRGVDSHGVARFNNYILLCKNGRINPQAAIDIIHETPSTATIDGNKGIGLVIGHQAMEVAIGKASQVGTGWVAVKNSNHFGVAANYVLQALDQDMIGIAMTNATATVAPTLSKEKMLGTNPICCAFPAGKEAPFFADFATTTVANGKLEILQRKNELAPDGWVQDSDGVMTHDPAILKEGGALLPLGGYEKSGGYKGFALGSMVDIFCGVLSGASFGPWVPPFPSYLPMPTSMPGEGVGHFFGAMRIDAFQPADVFKDRMDLWLASMRKAIPIDAAEPVLIPGDIENNFEKERILNGIPLLESVQEDLQKLALEFDIPFPNPLV